MKKTEVKKSEQKQVTKPRYEQTVERIVKKGKVDAKGDVKRVIGPSGE